jgi:hypothetical protein
LTNHICSASVVMPVQGFACEIINYRLRQVKLFAEKAVRVKEGDMELLPVYGQSGSVESVVKPALEGRFYFICNAPTRLRGLI